MRRILSIALFGAVVALTGWAQTSMTPAMQNAPARKAPMAEYAGGWSGFFEGHAWFVMRLSLQGNQITGTLQRAPKIELNDQGELKSVGDERTTYNVEASQLTGDGLLLTVKDPATQQTDRYVMRLTGPASAEVKMVAMSMPPGMPKPRPWKLTKAVANAVTPVR